MSFADSHRHARTLGEPTARRVAPAVRVVPLSEGAIILNSQEQSYALLNAAGLACLDLACSSLPLEPIVSVLAGMFGTDENVVLDFLDLLVRMGIVELRASDHASSNKDSVPVPTTKRAGAVNRHERPEVRFIGTSLQIAGLSSAPESCGLLRHLESATPAAKESSPPTASYLYEAYGLTIHSEICLPELRMRAERPRSAPDVDIMVDRHAREFCAAQVGYRASLHEFEVFDCAVGWFSVRGVNKIVVEPNRTADARIIRLFILGPLLAMLAHMRGALVLHGSAVKSAHGAVGFLGGGGAGKSTIAAFCDKFGFPVLTDDLLPVWREDDSFTTYAGSPTVRLWPSAAAALGIGVADLPLVHPRLEKRLYFTQPADDGCHERLMALFVLREGPSTYIERLTPLNAFPELIRYSDEYVVRTLKDTGAIASHALLCADLLRTVPIYLLTRPKSLGCISRIIDLVNSTVEGTCRS